MGTVKLYLPKPRGYVCGAFLNYVLAVELAE